MSRHPVSPLSLCLPVAALFLFSNGPTLADGKTDHGHGPVHFEITTDSHRAQHLFDRGLAQVYGFNHAEAAETFRQAIASDAECGMCWWGVGLALGPNINFPMVESNHAEARAAAERALELTREGDERERVYANALVQRYAESWVEERAELDQNYAKAMRRLARQFPGDLHAATLFAESLMDTTPWDYWLENGEPKDVTREFLSELESVLKRQPDHPGAAHYLIHTVEKARPELGVPAADLLATADQETGHLRHMAAHIYIRVGRYHDASRVNQEAIAKDEAYMAGKHQPSDYTAILAPHNVHFLWAATQLEGRSELSIATAEKLSRGTDQQLMREAGMETLQHFWVTPLYARARFGKWDEILAAPRPAEDLVYPTGVWHYARGMALVRTGELAKAEQELQALEAVIADQRLDAISLFGLNDARNLLDIGRHVLAGELSAARKDSDAAREHLVQAAVIQDQLTYDEPPPWYFPVRQAIGRVLLESGEAAAAERVYRQDLEEFPYNGWSLFGLAQALDQQGEKRQAKKVRKQLEKAWQHADFELTGSVM